jgi:glutamine amidotransferase
MRHIRELKLEEIIKSAARSKPFLGICLGLQILFDASEEGIERGLGIVPGMVRRFQSEPNLAIPQMGWNQLELTQPQDELWRDLPPNPYVYFVHSFYVEPQEPKLNSAMVTHGSQTVTAAIARDNLLAVQFHPEKSSDNGLKILANFVTSVKKQQKCLQ